MNRVESLLRTAARDEAAEVGRDTIPSFEWAGLPTPRRPLLRLGPLSGPLSGPFLAAVAVVAVVAVALTLSSVLPGSGHAPRPGSSVAPALAAGAVPPYYVALTATGTPATGHPFTITVRSTLTGKSLATVAPPSSLGTFSLVEGTADPETFLVGAQPWHPASIDGNPLGKHDLQDNSAQPVTLFMLRFDPATRGVRLTQIPLPRLAGKGLGSVSISPDGSLVAVAYRKVSKGVGISTWITVSPLRGGVSHTWSAPASVTVPGVPFQQPTNIIGALSWAADDRTLAFPLTGQRNGAYLLNTTATGTGSLLAASRLAVPLTGQRSNGDFVCDDDLRLSANGADVLCGGYTLPAGWSIEAKGYPTGPVTQGFGEFSAATGKLVAILGAVRAPVSLAVSPPNPYKQATTADIFPFLLWTSPDARVTIGLTDGGHAVLVRDGRTRRIPWPLSVAIPFGSNVPGAAW
jgi:hypothetical protein